MKLTFKDGRFLALCPFQEKDIAKGAGFQWDPKDRVWWTTDPAKARQLKDHATPEAISAIGDLTERERVLIERSFATETVRDYPVPAGLNYFNYQKAGISSAIDRKNVLIADEMGLGKTIQAIGVINATAPARVLIICPASLKGNWHRELDAWLVERQYPVILSTKHKARMNRDGIYIINYDILNRLEWLASTEWDLLIADECHAVKNKKAQRSKSFYEICKKSKAKIFLTGTPILNRPAEIFPMIQALGFPMSFWEFGKRYCEMEKGRFGLKADGSSNLDELNNKLRATVMIRRLKKDVLTDLPDKMRQVVTLPAENYQQELFREKEAEAKLQQKRFMLQSARDAAKGTDHFAAAVEALKEFEVSSIQEITRLRKETAIAKAPAVVAHVLECLESGAGPVILFAHHKEVISLLADGLKSVRVVKLTGDMDLQDRQRSVDLFQAGKADVFIGSIRAAGVGITLHRSSTVVFAEQDWTPGLMVQAEDRAHRIGQKNCVLVQVIVIEDSIDAKFAKTLLRKEKIANEALN